MQRLFLALLIMIGLASVGGCFNRSTEPVKKTDGESTFDRLKGMKGGGNPSSKAKGAAPKGGAQQGQSPKSGKGPAD